MKLNEKSYVHVKIRKLCRLLEQITGLINITDLGEEFEEIQFIDKYSYIIIDYKNETILLLSYKLSARELEIINDINFELNWLETGLRIQAEIEANQRNG